MKYGFAILALLLTSVAAQAQRDADRHEYKPGEAVTLRPDRAYILLRTYLPGGDMRSMPVFLRVPAADALAAPAQAPDGQNWFVAAKTYEKSQTERVSLVETVPGTYLILGAGFSVDGALMTCFCFGTVKFVAAPGVITDLGYVLGDWMDRSSAIPELRAVTGSKVNPDMRPIAATVRPYAEGMWLPPAIAGLARVAADYRAVPKFRNSFAYFVNRLAPVPGVLAYDGDRAIDMKASGPAKEKP
jgi:hypothetical protein